MNRNSSFDMEVIIYVYDDDCDSVLLAASTSDVVIVKEKVAPDPKVVIIKEELKEGKRLRRLLSRH